MPRAIAYAVRSGVIVDDPTFDRVFPSSHRFRSWMHWTPVQVARRACALLAVRPTSRVLDVGSGVGKLCLVGGLSTSATWVGIEEDAEMIEVARHAATALEVEDRVTFLHGDVTATDWSAYDAIYLFNPFAEQLFDHSRDALARRDRYAASVAHTETQLAQAQTGTRLVTYHGFGGEVPRGWDLIHREPALNDKLQVWVKRRRARTWRITEDLADGGAA